MCIKDSDISYSVWMWEEEMVRLCFAVDYYMVKFNRQSVRVALNSWLHEKPLIVLNIYEHTMASYMYIYTGAESIGTQNKLLLMIL